MLFISYIVGWIYLGFVSLWLEILLESPDAKPRYYFVIHVVLNGGGRGVGGGGGGLEWLFDNFICNCTSVNPLNNNTFLSGSFLSEMFG